MKYNLYTFTCLKRSVYVAELIQFDNHKDSHKGFLSPEELTILAKRKHKRSEFIFSRYIIKKVAKMSPEQAKLTTIKYCDSIKTAGAFQNKTLKKKLSLSHSKNFVLCFLLHSNSTYILIEHAK